MTKYSEHERQKIAAEEYTNYLLNQKVDIIGDRGDIKSIGYVSDVMGQSNPHEAPDSKGNIQRAFEASHGLDGYVITDKAVGDKVKAKDVREVTVLFRGSESSSDIEGTRLDWFSNDLRMADNILSSKVTGLSKGLTGQLKQAGQRLKNVMKSYPNARINIYGHSLGSMNGQASLSFLSDEELERIDGVYVYEGPNIYPALSSEGKKQVDKIKHRIFNYIDTKDIVPIGYPQNGSTGAVGTVIRVKSKKADNKIEQHMWGGYQWEKDNSLQIIDDNNSRYSKALYRVSDGMSAYYQLKAIRQSEGGGLSRNEEFFLDSEQASLLAKELHQVATKGKEAIKKLANKAVDKAEEVYEETRTIPWFVTELTSYEVQDAYIEGGATYNKLVVDTKEYFDGKVTKAEHLETTFSDLESKINKAIQTTLTKDKQLAGEFNQWKKTLTNSKLK